METNKIKTRKPTKFTDALKATPTKRIFGALLDKFLVILLTVLLGIITVNFILPAIPEVVSSQNETEALYVECLNEYELSKLRGIDHSTEPGNLEVLSTTFKNYATRHIDGTATIDNDNFAYFYVNYRKNNNMGEESQYNLRYLNKEIIGLPEDPSLYEGNFWSYNSINELVTFKDNIKTNLASYFDGTITEETQTIYNDALGEFERIYKLADNEFTQNQKGPFYNKYQAYVLKGQEFINYGTISIMICFTISFALLYIPITMINSGRTIGKLVFKTAVINSDDTSLTWVQKLIRVGITYLESWWTLLIVTGFFSSAMVTNPLFMIGNVPFSLVWIMILSFLLEIVSIGMLLITKDKLTLHDIIFRTEVVDVNTTFEKETKQTNTISTDKEEKNENEWSLENYQKEDNSVFKEMDKEKEENK